MSTSPIKPEKVTRPFQLMAAWFSMLVLIVTAFLTAATKIQKPEWAAGFLIIASFVLVFLVVLVVFTMLTKFRPHLQDGQEYSAWLKDERRYNSGDDTETIANQNIKTLKKAQVPTLKNIIKKRRTSGLRKYQADVIDIGGEDSYRIVSGLGRVGFNANIYVASFKFSNDPQTLEMHEAIWVGANIPPKMVCEAIRISLQIWPHLKYMHLSSDSSGPEFTHDQIFIGGATAAAKRIGLKPWTNTELLEISNDISFGELHRLIKTKYDETQVPGTERG